MPEKGKILMLVPAETASGGIKNYFQVLEGRLSLKVDYMVRGSRTWPYRKSMFEEFIRIWKDINDFQTKIKTGEYILVQTSTSLGLYSVIRDGIFIYLARKRGIKTIVFFRGWDLDFERKIEKYYLNIFRCLYFKTDSSMVLANQFREKLVRWGYPKKIYLESTIVDENSIAGISDESLINKYNNIHENINLLFLARVEVDKGIYETVEAFKILYREFPYATLTIAGEGMELNNLKKFVTAQSIKNVSYAGHVSGGHKIQTFTTCHLYIFPSYTEGMPNSLVEAMAFGLPVVSRPVGGISDLIINGENGYLTESKDPVELARLIRMIIVDKGLMIRMSLNNHRVAKERFTVTTTVKRLEKIYTEIINDSSP